MKTSYLLPLLLFGLICCLPACESDRLTTTIGYYSQEEYQVLSETLNLPSVPIDYHKFTSPGDRRNSIITLGRVLFYDKNLSADNSVSCSSCHQQHLAFSDDVALSTGIMSRSTARNSIALGVFQSFEDYSQDPQTTLFWDGRTNNLHDQMIQTIRNPNEMGMEMHQIVAKIKDLDYYKILTSKAFFSEHLDEELILLALENFMNSISSVNTKLDIVAASHGAAQVPQDWQGFTSQENLGKSLFQTNCISCHQQGLEAITKTLQLNGTRNTNNGLDLVYADKGAGEFDPSPEALAVFKIPSLRNIGLTAPYMHDGRFNTLYDVVDFYSDGIQNHPNLNPLLKNGSSPKRFNFTENEKDALVKFLETLTDHTMINEVRWSDPFL